MKAIEKRQYQHKEERESKMSQPGYRTISFRIMRACSLNEKKNKWNFANLIVGEAEAVPIKKRDVYF